MKKTILHQNTPFSLALQAGLLAICLSGFSQNALAQAQSRTQNHANVHMQASHVKTQVVNLPLGRSAIVDLPVDASDVFVSNPKVADAVLRTPRRIFIMGLGSGQSDAIFFDRMGNQILSLNIRVEAPTDQISDVVHRMFPSARVEIQSVNDHIILSGLVANNADASAIAQLAASYVSKPENVINLLSIVGKDQVMIKVRVIEVNRTAIKQLGFNTAAVFGGSTGNLYRFNQSQTFGVNQQLKGGGAITRAVNTAAKGGVESLTSSLQAFERAGLVRTLAEPQISSVSGEAAKFLAGGEFPVPVGRDNQGNITIQFKPYGVGLGFTPIVMSAGRISLKVSVEVSELTNEGGLTLTGLNIPGLSIRRSENTVEMASGESIMLAGLLQSRYKQTIDSLPGLTTLPVLGALFRSRDFLNDQSEMVMILTAYIISPTSPDNLQTPADNLQIASDMDTVFMGRLNKVIKAKKGVQDSAAPQDASQNIDDSKPYQAPIGFVIE